MGTPPIFLKFYVPLPSPFYYIFINKFSKFGVLYRAIFFENFPKISRKFSEIFSAFSKSKKTIVFAPKTIVPNKLPSIMHKFVKYCELDFRSFRGLVLNGYISGLFWGRGEGTSVEILSKFSKIVEILFSQERGFFSIFSRCIFIQHPKVTFYCSFINKFPKNFEKSARKFFRGAFGAENM